MYKELTEKGYRLIPVNPKADTVMGERCYPSLRDLPEPVGAPRSWCRRPRRNGGARRGRGGHQAGMDAAGRRVERAVKFCQENGISEVHGECILMFAQPQKFFHKPHRWMWGLIGKLRRHEITLSV